MSNLVSKLDADLKQAMLSSDKELVSVLRGLKSSIQYANMAEGVGKELSEQAVVKVLQKESKKRTDAVELYAKAGESERAKKEEYEKGIIDGYLPELLSKEEVTKLVDEVIGLQGELTQQNMGRIISEVKQKSGGLAEGSLIAQLVKERLSR
jgi:hypothetical protein